MGTEEEKFARSADSLPKFTDQILPSLSLLVTNLAFPIAIRFTISPVFHWYNMPPLPEG